MSSQEKITPADVARTFLERADAAQVDLQEVQQEIDRLAKRVTIDSVDVSEEAVSIEKDGHFSADGTIYVSLEYPEDVTVAEELPIRVEGQIDQESGRIEFERVQADLSPFYGEEA